MIFLLNVMGEFNAHHTHWSYAGTGVIRKRLFQASDASRVYLFNWDTVTRVSPADDGTSNIDLVLASEKMVGSIDICAWDDTMGSDHYPLYINVLSTKFFL